MTDTPRTKLQPRPVRVEAIGTGEVGFIVASIKDLHDVRIGDTVTDAVNPSPDALPGYKPIQQMVFCDFYPGGKTQYEELRDAMARAGRECRFSDDPIFYPLSSILSPHARVLAADGPLRHGRTVLGAIW